jgi:hypothetical protein
LSHNDQIEEETLKKYVQFADNERFVRGGQLASIKHPQSGEVHLAVTTARVIMYWWTKDILQINSADISDVRSIDLSSSSHQRTSLGIGLIIFGIIISIPTFFFVFTSSEWSYGLPLYLLAPLLIPLIPIVIGIYYIGKTYNSFKLTINIKSATGALQFYSYSEKEINKDINLDKLQLEAVPLADSVTMAQKLGGLVLNMQENQL